MKKILSLLAIIALFFYGCYYYYQSQLSLTEKANNLIEEIIKPTIPDGYTYKKVDTYIDSAYSQPLFIYGVREAAMDIHDLQKDMAKCSGAVNDSLVADFIKTTKSEIAELQTFIMNKRKDFKKEFNGWRITHKYLLRKNGEDSLVVVGLLTDKNVEYLQCDDIITPHLAKEYKILKEIVDECI